MLAVSYKNINTANFLLSKGAEINKQTLDGISCLHLAVTRNLPDMVFILLKIGADLTLKDKLGHTPLDVAKNLNSEEIIQMLSNYKKG